MNIHVLQYFTTLFPFQSTSVPSAGATVNFWSLTALFSRVLQVRMFSLQSIFFPHFSFLWFPFQKLFNCFNVSWVAAFSLKFATGSTFWSWSCRHNRHSTATWPYTLWSCFSETFFGILAWRRCGMATYRRARSWWRAWWMHRRRHWYKLHKLLLWKLKETNVNAYHLNKVIEASIKKSI